MIEKLSLRLFWAFMLVCAFSTIVAIWTGNEPENGFFKIIPTTFILGMASFLFWAPHMAYRLVEAIRG